MVHSRRKRFLLLAFISIVVFYLAGCFGFIGNLIAVSIGGGGFIFFKVTRKVPLSLPEEAFAGILLILVGGSNVFCYHGWEAYERGGGASIGEKINLVELGKAAESYAWSKLFDPLNLDARTYRGKSLLLGGRAPEALEEFRMAAVIFPLSFTAHYGKARCFKELGDLEAMVESLRTARRFQRHLSECVRFDLDFASLKNDPHLAEFQDEF